MRASYQRRDGLFCAPASFVTVIGAMAEDDWKPPPDEEFVRAMEGVTKLPESPPRKRSRRSQRERGEALARPATIYEFEVERYGEQVEGIVSGADRKQLRKLRRGDYPPEAEFDLHGMRQAEAQRAVGRIVRDAYDGGLRSVLIIHGRGRGSEERAVLKQDLPGWLTEQAIAPLVLAFCTAPVELGAGGALLVLLRRNKAASR